ncbi:MAG TPA: GNAT family N-acetyltransferase [Geminicoccaceae bacterium]|nr:GNAT family N-acetyltransferase [Geminicoccaceae bacterium]
MAGDSGDAALVEADRRRAADLVAGYFGSTAVVSRGVSHDICSLPGLIARTDGRRIGLLQYRQAADQLEIVVLIACRPPQGIGRCLLEAAKSVAQSQACWRLWLITTNDNRPALAFCRAVGWRRCAIHRGAVAAARRLKPQIPRIGHAGIPIEDEIEFEFLIGQRPHVRD